MHGSVDAVVGRSGDQRMSRVAQGEPGAAGVVEGLPPERAVEVGDRHLGVLGDAGAGHLHVRLLSATR